MCNMQAGLLCVPLPTKRRIWFKIIISHMLNQEIIGTWVYKSYLLAYTSILFSTRIEHSASILNSLNITWFNQQKHFRPGGIAPSEWTPSVGAVRDTPVADNSAPGVNITRRVAYHPPIAVSPFLLALSVYTKWTLYLSHLLISLELSTISGIYAIAWILAAG